MYKKVLWRNLASALLLRPWVAKVHFKCDIYNPESFEANFFSFFKKNEKNMFKNLHYV